MGKGRQSEKPVSSARQSSDRYCTSSSPSFHYCSFTPLSFHLSSHSFPIFPLHSSMGFFSFLFSSFHSLYLAHPQSFNFPLYFCIHNSSFCILNLLVFNLVSLITIFYFSSFDSIFCLFPPSFPLILLLLLLFLFLLFFFSCFFSFLLFPHYFSSFLHLPPFSTFFFDYSSISAMSVNCTMTRRKISFTVMVAEYVG